MAVDFCLTLSSRRFGALPNRAATSTTVGQLRDASGRVLVASTPAEPAPTASTSAGQVLSRALIESPVEAGRIADGGAEEVAMSSAGSSACEACTPSERSASVVLDTATFRTEDGTSGRGASSATSLSMSTRRALRAWPRTRSWFSIVRRGRSIRTALRLSSPEARPSRMTGNFRQAPGGVDAIRRGVLGESQRVPAIGEERSVSLRGIQRGTQPQRGQVRHELGGRRALVGGQDRNAGEKVAIGQRDCDIENILAHNVRIHTIRYTIALSR